MSPPLILRDPSTNTSGVLSDIKTSVSEGATTDTSLVGGRAHDLLDDLIRAQQQRWRDGEAERFRGLQIDD
jgi:hypothetical protein